MNKMQQLVNNLDIEMTSTYEEYIRLHREFDMYRGKNLKEEELEAFNNILEAIQKNFMELYPVYYFIGHRYEYATNVVKEYEAFMEMIKKLGAVEKK